MSSFKNWNNYINKQGILRKRLAQQAEKESGVDGIKYQQLLVGPGKTFERVEPGESAPLKGLAGSDELESIRREIAQLPKVTPPRPSNIKLNTGGKRSKATQKASRKMRRKTMRGKNMRKRR